MIELLLEITLMGGAQWRQLISPFFCLAHARIKKAQKPIFSPQLLFDMHFCPNFWHFSLIKETADFSTFLTSLTD